MADVKNIKQAKVLHVTNTTSAWSAIDTVISKGLLCIEFTTDGKTKAKVGDGVKTFAELPYLTDGSISIENYYTKSETDEAISNAIDALGDYIRIKGIVANVSDLPNANNEIGDLYFVGTQGETSDSFAEYVYTANNKFEFLGRVQTDIDLSEYVTDSELQTAIDAVNDRIDALETDSHTHTNKQILDNITASYTTEEQTKLAGIEAEANKTIVDSELSKTSTNPVENQAIATKIETIETNITNLTEDSHEHDNKAILDDIEVAYTTEMNTKLSGIEAEANKTIVDSTLSATSTNPVENQAVKSALDNKVDKVDGKGLSTEDYTTAEKTKLASLENYDDTELSGRVSAIEEDYLKESDYLIINCVL